MNTDSPIRLTIKLCLNYGFHSLIAQQMKYFFKGILLVNIKKSVEKSNLIKITKEFRDGKLLFCVQ